LHVAHELPPVYKMKRCPNLNSAHTQTNLLAHQQNVDRRSLGAQSGDSSAFVFRCANALSDSFLSNHPVSHRQENIKANSGSQNY